MCVYFPTCQVKIVRFCFSCTPPLARLPQLRGPSGSVPRRTSTARAERQCSPPDLNHRERRLAAFPAELNREFCLATFPAGPQPRAAAGNVPRRRPQPRALVGSVPRQTSTASSQAHWALPDLNQHTKTSTNTNTESKDTTTSTVTNSHIHKHTTTNRSTNTQPPTQSQTHNNNTQTQRHIHTTTTHNHNSQPEDPQAKSENHKTHDHGNMLLTVA